MSRTRLLKGTAIAGACALIGAAAGIAGSAAAPGGHSKSAAAGPGYRHAGPVWRKAGPPVHVDAVVPNSSGGFDTITMDNGTFKSLSGDQLTITEGTKTATYKTVTLTVPANATVFRNGASAALSALQSGDAVRVVQAPQGTRIVAFDAQHRPAFPFRGGWRGRHLDRFAGPMGPPPGAPMPAPAQ